MLPYIVLLIMLINPSHPFAFLLTHGIAFNKIQKFNKKKSIIYTSIAYVYLSISTEMRKFIVNKKKEKVLGRNKISKIYSMSQQCVAQCRWLK